MIHLYFDKEVRQAVWNGVSNICKNSNNNNRKRLDSTSSSVEIIDWSNKKASNVQEMFVRRIEVKSIAPMIRNGTNNNNKPLGAAGVFPNKMDFPIPKRKLRSTGHAIFNVIR